MKKTLSPFLIVTRKPSQSILTFADELSQVLTHDVYIISDNPLSDYPRSAKAIYIDDDEARNEGFSNSSLITDKPIAWDKALYLLAKNKIDFNYVWIMEDDVLFSSPDLARALVTRYEHSDADLISATFFRRAESLDWAHWYRAEHFDQQHQAFGFLPLCRLSKRMINSVQSFSQEHGSLAFIEVLFPSLALRDHLSVETLDFLDESRFRFGPPFQRWELLQRMGLDLRTGIFHPVKNEALRHLAMMKYQSWRHPATWERLLFKFIGPSLQTIRRWRAS